VVSLPSPVMVEGRSLAFLVKADTVAPEGSVLPCQRHTSRSPPFGGIWGFSMVLHHHRLTRCFTSAD
jgi:hypothetical protein